MAGGSDWAVVDRWLDHRRVVDHDSASAAAAATAAAEEEEEGVRECVTSNECKQRRPRSQGRDDDTAALGDVGYSGCTDPSEGRRVTGMARAIKGSLTGACVADNEKEALGLRDEVK